VLAEHLRGGLHEAVAGLGGLPRVAGQRRRGTEVDRRRLGVAVDRHLLVVGAVRRVVHGSMSLQVTP
jgi:hypothetical protein